MMTKILLQFVIIFLVGGAAFAQPDTVVVPSMVDGDPFGAINKFIIGDTTATGDRVNSERYYKLQKDNIYFLDGTFFSDFDLRLIADEPADGEKPPIVASTAGANGVIQLIQFKLFGNGYVKNIIFQMTPPTSNGESNACFFLSGEGKSYEFDNVKIEWGLWTGMVTEVPVNKIIVKNCYFRNPQHKTNIWNGRGVGFFMENPADTVIMQNNTFFNMNSFAFFADISSIPPNYFFFDHNTIVNSMKFPLHSFWLPDAKVTNNLFYNAHSYGENDADRVGQDPDLMQYGIINISPIPADLIDYYGIAEEERRYVVENNGFFYADPIKDYWNANTLEPSLFMNERVLNMFDDNATFPFLDVSNTLIDEDPGFVNEGEGMAPMIQWMQNRRDLMGNTYWGWDPDNDKFAVQWPFPEDLSYSNEVVKTGAAGGFPLGDLNWWLAEKAEWEVYVLTDVDDVPDSQIEEMTIAPNPTEDHLTINYALKEKSVVKISVFAMSGAEVAQVFEGTQSAGQHTIDWSIPNSVAGGLYLIKISDWVGSITRKVAVHR